MSRASSSAFRSEGVLAVFVPAELDLRDFRTLSLLALSSPPLPLPLMLFLLLLLLFLLLVLPPATFLLPEPLLPPLLFLIVPLADPDLSELSSPCSMTFLFLPPWFPLTEFLALLFLVEPAFLPSRPMPLKALLNSGLWMSAEAVPDTLGSCSPRGVLGVVAGVV